MKTGNNISGGSYCWTCGKTVDTEEMANSSQCDTCYYANVSRILSEKRTYKKRNRYIHGITKHKSRYVNQQIKAHKCGDCGSKLHIGSDFFCHGLRLVQLNCYGMDAHSYYAFIDLTAKIIAIYRTGSWIEAAGHYQDPDIPF